MKTIKQKLTLDRATTYQIRVPGELDEYWGDWASIKISFESDKDGSIVTTLTGSFDQAALQGILRRLYAVGLPLISVNCIEYDIANDKA
jgi:hypothetical protein